MKLNAAAAIEDSSSVRRNPRSASRIVEGKALVVVIDRRKLHTLNAVGTRIWEMADGRSLGDIIDVLADEFDVDRDTAGRDARRFVSELAELGAVQVERTTSQ